MLIAALVNFDSTCDLAKTVYTICCFDTAVSNANTAIARAKTPVFTSR